MGLSSGTDHGFIIWHNHGFIICHLIMVVSSVTGGGLWAEHVAGLREPGGLQRRGEGLGILRAKLVLRFLGGEHQSDLVVRPDQQLPPRPLLRLRLTPAAPFAAHYDDRQLLHCCTSAADAYAAPHSCCTTPLSAVAASLRQATNPRWLPPEVIKGAGASLASDV